MHADLNQPFGFITAKHNISLIRAHLAVADSCLSFVPHPDSP